MDEYCKNTFVRAAVRGNVRILKQMLKKGIDVNKCDLDGKSPLLLAMENGHKEAKGASTETETHVTHGDSVRRVEIFACVTNYYLVGKLSTSQT